MPRCVVDCRKEWARPNFTAPARGSDFPETFGALSACSRMRTVRCRLAQPPRSASMVADTEAGAGLRLRSRSHVSWRSELHDHVWLEERSITIGGSHQR